MRTATVTPSAARCVTLAGWPRPLLCTREWRPAPTSQDGRSNYTGGFLISRASRSASGTELQRGPRQPSDRGGTGPSPLSLQPWTHASSLGPCPCPEPFPPQHRPTRHRSRQQMSPCSMRDASHEGGCRRRRQRPAPADPLGPFLPEQSQPRRARNMAQGRREGGTHTLNLPGDTWLFPGCHSFPKVTPTKAQFANFQSTRNTLSQPAYTFPSLAVVGILAASELGDFPHFSFSLSENHPS